MRQTLVSISAFAGLLFAISLFSPVVISDSGVRQLAGIPSWVILDTPESVSGEGCCSLDPKQGGEIPTCANCEPVSQINDYPDFVFDQCGFLKPWRKHFYVCVKMQCTEGHYYYRGYQNEDGCAAQREFVPCPPDTCEKPGLGG